MRTLIRQNDTMVAVETAPAIVDYTDILDATKVVCDNNSEAPWDICDGFEHTVKSFHRAADNISDFNVEQMRGYCHCDSYYGGYIVIQLSEKEDYGLYKWHRERGATKQVAHEIIATERRRTLDQLVQWYSNGWEWYGVRCDFSLLGQDFSASVWGIDDSNYAGCEVLSEIADDVADQLEKAGFTVIGRPERVPYPSRAQKQEHIRYNLALQNWKN